MDFSYWILHHGFLKVSSVQTERVFLLLLLFCLHLRVFWPRHWRCQALFKFSWLIMKKEQKRTKIKEKRDRKHTLWSAKTGSWLWEFNHRSQHLGDCAACWLYFLLSCATSVTVAPTSSPPSLPSYPQPPCRVWCFHMSGQTRTCRVCRQPTPSIISTKHEKYNRVHRATIFGSSNLLESTFCLTSIVCVWTQACPWRLWVC